MKPYSDLTLLDDFMFCKVMTTRMDLCKHLIELILGIRIREIKIDDAQKTISMTADSRGIRLDVYAEDEEQSVYDLEMQTAYDSGLPKRSRYYQGMIDLNSIEHGISVKNLRKSFIIFICDFDPFGYGKPRYIFENICTDDPGCRLGDETYKVFVNIKAKQYDNISEELKAVLDYLHKGTATDEYTVELSRFVDEVKNGEKWKVDYMTFGMKLDETYEKGIEKGEANVRQQTRLIFWGMYKDGVISLSEGAKRLEISEEEFLKIGK